MKSKSGSGLKRGKKLSSNTLTARKLARAKMARSASAKLGRASLSRAEDIELGRAGYK